LKEFLDRLRFENYTIVEVSGMNNLKNLRMNLGITQKEFAHRIGIGAATYNGYENGVRDPRSDFWKQVAETFGVTTDYLLDVKPLSSVTSLSREANRIAERYEKLDKIGRGAIKAILNYEENRIAEENEDEELEQIRLYLIPPAAGYAQPIEGEDYELIDKPKDAPAEADFCLHISGDSMEPYLHDRQLVYVQRGVPLQQFDVGIFFFGGDVFIKQYYEDEAGNIELMSANPLRRDANIHIERGDTRAFICFGKVLLPKRLPEPAYTTD